MIFSTTTRPLLNSPLFTTTSSITHRPLFHRRISLPTIIKMSTTSSPAPPTSTSIVEHVVLFNVKPTTQPPEISTMVNSLNSLSKLPMVLHLTTTNVHRNRSSSLSFTHILHSRYSSKQDLADYSAHPDHLSVVRTNVLPICDDLMAVDWVANADDSHNLGELNTGNAVRVQLIKLKEDGDEKEKEKGKEEVLKVIRRVAEKIGGVEQITVGENFSPARAKGFDICSVRVFGGVEGVDALDEDVEIAEMVEKEKDKVREFIDNLVVVDFVVPNLQSSSL